MVSPGGYISNVVDVSAEGAEGNPDPEATQTPIQVTVPSGVSSYQVDVQIDGAWCNIMDVILDEYLWLYSETGEKRGTVDVLYPCSVISNSMYNEACDRIDMPSPQGWDDNQVQHEYAHAFMKYLYGYTPGSMPDSDSNHEIADEKYESHAICEGWAEFVDCAIDNNANDLFLQVEGKITNIEKNHWEKSQDDNGVEE